MVAGKPSRYLAPLALAAAVTATVVVVTSRLHSSHHSHNPAVRLPAVTASTPTPSARHTRGARSYVVKSGDTLSSIAAKTGIPLSTIESLNPSVNPSSLHTGQRLKLGQ